MDTYVLLVIDTQYDFCDPMGALYVPGTEKDMRRLASFIKRNKQTIGHICLTMDSHPYLHISHPCFWKSLEGNHPAPFTVITSHDVKIGKWIPQFVPDYALNYLEKLEQQEQFPHVIWTYHYIAGTRGFAIVEELMEAIREWSFYRGKPHQIVLKGCNPYTEHFGIFAANLPIENQQDTMPNYDLLHQLDAYSYIIIAGEARSHCVATSLNQILFLKPDMAKKLLVLEDCMSDIPGFEEDANPIYQKAVVNGAQILFSKNFL